MNDAVSKTPITNGVVEQYQEISYQALAANLEHLARQLERELAEAKELAQRYYAVIEHIERMTALGRPRRKHRDPA